MKPEYSYAIKEEEQETRINSVSRKDETLERDTIDKIIEEEKMNHLLRASERKLHTKHKEDFKWYKVFNRGLIQLKYQLAFC